VLPQHVRTVVPTEESAALEVFSKGLTLTVDFDMFDVADQPARPDGENLLALIDMPQFAAIFARLDESFELRSTAPSIRAALGIHVSLRARCTHCK